MKYKMTKHNADLLTPIRIFKRLEGKNKFLLESSVQHGDKGKYSFIGVDPYKEIIGNKNQTTVNYTGGKKEQYSKGPFEYLKENFEQIEIDVPLPFYGGAIGYIGYNATEQLDEIALHDDLEMPDVHLMVYKNIIVFNHATETVYLITINIHDESEHVLDQQLTNLEKIFDEQPLRDNNDIPTVAFKHEMNKHNFIKKVEQAKQAIKRGEVDQIVLSQRLNGSFTSDPFAFYRQLRKTNPSPYMFYITFDDYIILGASPESLIQTKGTTVITNPIAGTRPRGKTYGEDEDQINDLLTDKKEIAEHEMLVELSKADLESVCFSDSIHVPINMEIEKFEHVIHIVSEVHGKLRKQATSLDALTTCLPAGTVSGYPKQTAMKIINKLETIKRGPYGGSIGYINFNFDLNMALAIRFLTIKNDQAYLQTGAGIVHDSDPEKEYEETLHKARSLMTINGNKRSR